MVAECSNKNPFPPDEMHGKAYKQLVGRCHGRKKREMPTILRILYSLARESVEE